MRKKYSERQSEFGSYFLLLNGKCNIDDPESALIFDRLTYVIFAIAMMPMDNMGELLLNELSKMYLEVKEMEDSWYFTPQMARNINNNFYSIKNILPLKKGIKVVAKELRNQLENQPFRNGIELGVLCRLMDMSKSPYLKEELPFHSRIGFGYHSSMVVNEEQQLLSDSFYLLVLGEKEYIKMLEYAKEIKQDIDKYKEPKSLITKINSNVCTYCRNSVVSFFSFFEAYINSIGVNYLYLYEEKLSTEEVFALKGKDRQGNQYLKLEIKIECLQRIIANKITYTTNNPQQLKDKTFLELFSKIKSRRDVAVHFSKGKGEIIIAPQYWLDEAFDISELVVDASKKIYKACFNTKNFPSYLRKFDYKYLFDEAKERIIEF